MKKLVMIANSEWALFIRWENEHFEVLEEREHPASKAKVMNLVSDRPGRTLSRVCAERHSLNEGQDVLETERERFARELAQSCQSRYKVEPFQELLIVTGPKFLGELRAIFQHLLPLPYTIKEIHKEVSSHDSLEEKMKKVQQWVYEESPRKR